MKYLSVYFLLFCCLCSISVADVTIYQTEELGIPFLPDWSGTATTYCANDRIKVDYDINTNFVTKFVISQMTEFPDRIYSLSDNAYWSLYPDKEVYRVRPMAKQIELTDSMQIALEEMREAEGLAFEWDISAIGQTVDTVAGIACDRLFVSGIGKSYGEDTATCEVSADIRTAVINEENEPINETYLRLQDKYGFDPLEHYIMGLVFGAAFGIDIETIRGSLETMRGFPIQMKLVMEIDGGDIIGGKFSYTLDILEVNNLPVKEDIFRIPEYYQREEHKQTESQER